VPRPRPLATLALLGALGTLALAGVTGCGGSSSSNKTSASAQVAAPASFPSAAGKTLTQLRAGLPRAGVLAPSVSLLTTGINRIGFALFDPSMKMIAGVPVALYVADASGRHLQGPFRAVSESLAVKPAYESQTVAQDPTAAHNVYVAHVPISSGKPIIVALAKIGGKLVTTTGTEFDVPVPGAQPPNVGQKAIVVHTPTIAGVGGRASLIDTRVPPATDLQQADLANVVGRKPTVLMFATPQLCQSRVCGPVVDVEDQVRSQTPSSVAFIHVEIYKNNTVADGFLPQVAAWHLPTEPWTFVIDRTGLISSRFEGALSADELSAAVKKVE
jgi:hypothetical protein